MQVAPNGKVTCGSGANAITATAAELAADSTACLRSYGAGGAPTGVGASPSVNEGQGVRLTYGGGASCGSSTGQLSVAKFNFNCGTLDEQEAWQQASLTLNGNCELLVTVSSKDGCGEYQGVLEKLGWGWTFLLVASCLTAVYIGVGAAWKKFKRGASGMEVVPHIDSIWRPLTAYIVTGWAVVWSWLTCSPLPSGMDYDTLQPEENVWSSSMA